MSDRLSLTIVIPAYNEADILAECLDSIAAQTIKPDAVILVDNGSTDATAAIARQYGFVKLIKEPVKGRWSARRAGILASKTDLVGQIDADSHIAEDWVATIKDYFAKHPQTAAITGVGSFYNMPGKPVHAAVHSFGYYHLQKLVSGHYVMWGANMVTRRQAVLEIIEGVPLDNDYDEDVMISLLMNRQGYRIDLVPALKAEMSLQRDDMSVKGVKQYLSTWERNYRLVSMPRKAKIIRAMTAAAVVGVVPIATYRYLRRRK